MLAVILGSGSRHFPLPERQVRRLSLPTSFTAEPVSLIRASLEGGEVLILHRHGEQHEFAPHEINYRANIWALREAGARRVVAVAACGGIKAAYAPGALVVPHQIIDYTYGRAHSYFGSGELRHIDFTQPYDDTLRRALIRAARAADATALSQGVYAATQGPRLETAAEIDRLERDGCDIVGMTGMPEAALARELDLAYACCGIVVNAAAGRGGPTIDLGAIDRIMAARMRDVHAIVLRLLAG